MKNDLDTPDCALGQGNCLGYLLISLPAPLFSFFFCDSIRSDNNRIIYFVLKDSSIN